MQQSLKLPFLYLSKATFIVATGDSFPAENAEPIAKNKTENFVISIVNIAGI